MASIFKFAADAVLRGKAYPALAEWSAQPYTPEWRQFRYYWPYTVPAEIIEHCVTHGFDCEITSVKYSSEPNTFYVIGLGFFDFAIDYFDLVPLEVFEQRLTILFYYHEGDNPYRIQQRLDDLCQQHGLDKTCYRFVSGNTAADHIARFAWFPDHELLYWHRNQQVPATIMHLDHRPYIFTVLNRTHKWWRATVMADLQRAGILDVSQWSYNTHITVDDDLADNPIEIDVLELRNQVERFMSLGPYTCDNLTSDQHNDHHLHVPEHYTNSYCHIVLETHFDADQSGGAFLTEKTFKPIKHGQPFVIIGAPGTLQALRDLGYRTFDHVIDNTYDLIQNNTERYLAIRHTITKIKNNQNLKQWFDDCQDDIKHNQQMFATSKWDRINQLYTKLIR